MSDHAHTEDRLTRESGLTLIEEAQRWQRAYEQARDDLAAAREALREDEKTLTRLRIQFEAMRVSAEEQQVNGRGEGRAYSEFWRGRAGAFFDAVAIVEDHRSVARAVLAADGEG